MRRAERARITNIKQFDQRRESKAKTRAKEKEKEREREIEESETRNKIENLHFACATWTSKQKRRG